MRPFHRIRIDFRILILLTLLLSACGAKASYRYYTLAPVPSGSDGLSIEPGAPLVVLGIGPVTIPDYLDRPQIVTRTSRNELTLSEYSRWAGSFGNDASRVLEENLDTMLLADGIAVVSWRRGVPNDYRVAVQITRFDVTDGVDVELNAQWVIYAKDGKKVLLLRESAIRKPVTGSGYDPAVEGMGQALADLSRDILQGVRLVRESEVGEQGAGVGGVLPGMASPVQ
jgi:uncharacterized lipoprotein YmbA